MKLNANTVKNKTPFKDWLNRWKLIFKSIGKRIEWKMEDLQLWIAHKKRLRALKKQKAPKHIIHLEKGAYYMRKGAIYQVGQPLKYFVNKKPKVKYIKNLYFNFKLNKITASYSEKPIKGVTEKF